MNYNILDIIPSAIEFEYCAVGTVATKTFTIHNKYNAALNFHIKYDEFMFVPSEGTIEAKDKLDITISYTPSEAKAIVATAIFHIDTDYKVIKLSAIGKYPYIGINAEKIDFGELLVGMTTTKEIILSNQNLVSADFQIERIDINKTEDYRTSDEGLYNSFSLDITKGTIHSNSAFRILVTYVPSIVNMFSSSHYKVTIKGGNEAFFSCVGSALGFDTCISSKSVHFGEVTLGNTTNRVLNIFNKSGLSTCFQFINDKSNVFSLSTREGVIKKNSDVRIIITFTPQDTMNYYERVFCIVKSHYIHYVDLMGTCTDILQKPFPLYQRHVDQYRHKVIMGMHNRLGGTLGDETMHVTGGGTLRQTQSKHGYMQSQREKQSAGKTGNVLQLSKKKARANGHQSPQVIQTLDPIATKTMDDEALELNEEIPIDDPSQTLIHKEMLLQVNNPNRDVHFKEDILDFMFSNKGVTSNPLYVTVVNNFNFPLIVNWVIPPSFDSNNQPIKIFTMKTLNSELKAHSEQEFQITFKPNESNLYYFRRIQCYLVRKTGMENRMRKIVLEDPTNVHASTVSFTRTSMSLHKFGNKGKGTQSMEELEPPICLNLPVVGHSFPPGSQPFLPMLSITPSSKIFFLPCAKNESVFQTIQLNNKSDTPIFFKILKDPTNTFRISPNSGLISGQSLNLICIEFHPRECRKYTFALQLLLNHSSTNIKKLHLIGLCHAPNIKLNGLQDSDDEKKEKSLYYPPTYMGVSTRQKIKIINKTLISLDVNWNVPEKYKREILFEPQSFRLRGNELVDLLCTFTPLKGKPYYITTPLGISGVYEPLKDMIGYYNPGSGSAQKHTIVEEKTPPVQKNFLIIGAGADSYIQIFPLSLDFGTVKVGDELTRKVVLHNQSKSNVFVELNMMMSVSENEDQNNIKKIKEMFKYDFSKGVLNSHSKKTITITFKPKTRCNFDIIFNCLAKERPVPQMLGSTVTQTFIQEKCYATITAKGDFPLIKLIDIRNEYMSTSNLWDLFNFTALNNELLSPLSQIELEFNNSDKTNHSMADLQNRLKVFEWNFGKIAQKPGVKPRKVILTLKNVGGVGTEFLFKMPNDSEIELEAWADPGEPTTDQAFEAHILQKGLFDIETRQGFLKPDQELDVEAYYYPKEIGTHHLNIFFRVLNGKPVILKIKGETLPRRGHLELKKDVYKINCLPIDLLEAITYPIEIKNIGYAKIRYEIDTTPIHELNAANHNFRIFDIQYPKGELLANETQYIYTLFKPIEVKTYSVTLPIKVSDIEGCVQNLELKIEGSGYHSNEPETKPTAISLFEDLPPCRMHLGGKGSEASFSVDQIDFGEVNRGTPARRCLLLYNHSTHMNLIFAFQRTGLICADELNLEPISGEIKAGSHVVIKMTLNSARIATSFEGEIECLIEWGGDTSRFKELEMLEKQRIQSRQSVNLPNTESLFLRIKKTSVLKKDTAGCEHRDEELLENVLRDAISEIFEDDSLENLLEKIEEEPSSLFALMDNSEPPSCKYLSDHLHDEEEKEGLENQYNQMIRDVNDCSEHEIERKRMFLDKNFILFVESILDSTIFNIMQETTYKEFDLCSPPKTYIKKTK